MLRTFLAALALVISSGLGYAQSTGTEPIAPMESFTITKLLYKTSATQTEWSELDLTGMNLNIPAAAANYDMRVEGTYTPSDA